MATKLTKKAERFCRECLIDYDPEAAAVRAGYAPADDDAVFQVR